MHNESTRQRGEEEKRKILKEIVGTNFPSWMKI